MQAAEQIKKLSNRYPLLGPIFWAASIQYFIVMSLVAWAWPTHYNALNNTISDLGNTVCGIYDGRYVCSPQHAWMNASFIVLGSTMFLGSALIFQRFRKTLGSQLGFTFMTYAGFGTIMVGIFAENTISSLHVIGAALPFVVGNLALIILGLSLDLTRPFRIYTLVSGVVSLVAFGLFATHNYLGLGIGGMERLASHPQTIWLIAFSIYMTMDSLRSIFRKTT